jgi:hypothetical protein
MLEDGEPGDGNVANGDSDAVDDLFRRLRDEFIAELVAEADGEASDLEGDDDHEVEFRYREMHRASPRRFSLPLSRIVWNLQARPDDPPNPPFGGIDRACIKFS